MFATYWRDVPGPLCSRVPALAWYVQYHLDGEQDAHLWSAQDRIVPFRDYLLSGGVAIGFANTADQAIFNKASSILFSDEQNMTIPAECERPAILDLTFGTPLVPRRFFASDSFSRAIDEQKQNIGHVTAFAVSGMYTYVDDKELTLAGLRGSRPAQLIEQLGAINQTAEDLRHLMVAGRLD